jgi:hypothetical protein
MFRRSAASNSGHTAGLRFILDIRSLSVVSGQLLALAWLKR